MTKFLPIKIIWIFIIMKNTNKLLQKKNLLYKLVTNQRKMTEKYFKAEYH